MYMKNKVLLTNLDKMGETYGRNIDGVLGYDFFVRGIFTINFVKKEFEMYIYTNPVIMRSKVLYSVFIDIVLQQYTNCLCPKTELVNYHQRSFDTTA